QGAGRDRGNLGEDARPEGSGGGEAVDEAAALQERGPVGADQVDRVVQEGVELGRVAGETIAGKLDGARHAGPEHGVEVQRPAHVVVVTALVAVGEPAALAAETVV